MNTIYMCVQGRRDDRVIYLRVLSDLFNEVINVITFAPVLVYTSTNIATIGIILTTKQQCSGEFLGAITNFQG